MESVTSRVRACAVALAGLAAIGAAKPAPQPPSYELSPEIEGGQLKALRVTLKLTAGPDGKVQLELPDESAGVTELWRYLHDLKVEGATSVSSPKPSERAIQAKPGATITVTYRVVSAFDHEPPVSELETNRPLIRPTRFWAYGETLFAYPTNAKTASVRWTGAPAGFGFAASYQRPTAKPLPINDLIESVSVGGTEFKLYRREIGGAPIRVAMIGKFGFSDQAFTDTALKVIAGERAFWGRKEGPFLVVAAPLGAVPHSISFRGEGRAGAFAVQGGADTPLNFIKSLLAHEYFHNWNPPRLGGMHEGDAERGDYWFSEGFTDFYARHLALRSQVLGLDDFVREWNDNLRHYAGSSLRTAPSARVVADFWKDNDARRLPYERGAILAATFDRELRARSGGKVGLDQVMRAMRDRAAKLGAKSPKAPQLFEATVHSFGLDVRPQIERLIETGGATMLPEDAFGGCVRVTTGEAPRFERGYETETKDGVRVLTKVDAGSAAYAAGLRVGMTVRGVNGYPGHAEKPWKVTVLENGHERDVSYLPAGKTTVTLQQLEIPADLTPAAKAACEKAVAAEP